MYIYILDGDAAKGETVVRSRLVAIEISKNRFVLDAD